MPHVQRPLRALLLAAVLATSSSSATYIRYNPVFERAAADVCGGDPDLSRCAQPGLPDNFCCGKDTACLPLAGDTTVLCCPADSNCDNITPIVCDLGLQDAAKNPKAAIKTTVLGGKLETCGGGCCPFGYSCDAVGSCTKDKDQSKKPGDGDGDGDGGAGSSPSPTSTPMPPTTTTTTTLPETSQSGSGSAPAKPTKTASKGQGQVATSEPSTEDGGAHAPADNITGVVGGAVGGVVGLACVAALVMFVRYRRHQAARKRHDSSSSFGNIISAPQPLSGFPNQRQDFLAAKATTSSVATTPTQAQERFGFSSHQQQQQQQKYRLNGPSPYSPPFAPFAPFAPSSQQQRQPAHDSSPRSHHPSAEVGGLRNLTYNRFSGGDLDPPATPRRRQSSAGSESINIFADPSTVGSGSGGGGGGGDRRDTAYTTWTTIMADGDGEETPGLPDTPTRTRRRP